MIKSNRGQLSIFMGITLILVMGLLAFLINVGLFVKAKINLQNSVDAAAYAGAAVQARQLTNIAYANWELRNTYKEWMFKYYILGQLGLMQGDYNLSPGKLGGLSTSFLLMRPSATVVGTGGVSYDKYNLPSICIHNNSQTNICPIYALPGIPRFPAIGVAGISEIHEAFVNKLVDEKGANCSERTQINFLAAMSWAYSSGLKSIPGAPLVATNRPGAWPQALELGMRIRNLEMIVNRTPVSTPMDLNTVLQLSNQGANLGLNERPIKAFMSAYRNLSGGKYKSNTGGGSLDEFATSFRLSELEPTPFNSTDEPVSSFLIPPGHAARTKYYLDLQAVPLNLATMFTTFATTRNEFEPSVDSEASCHVSKTAMPVPGYLLGFVKNPTVLTYYAVKGEANFTGLFFPKSDDDDATSIKLTAYAAAKPFGGRIGPQLFKFVDARSVAPRLDENDRSASYVSGIRVPISGFVPGMPLPPNQSFWVTETDIVGGVPEASDNVTYGVPNMIYDFSSASDLDVQKDASEKIQLIRPLLDPNFWPSEKMGLYHTNQFKALRANLGPLPPGTTISADQVMSGIVKARGVTNYDAINYLVPDYRERPNNEDNVIPLIRPLPLAVQGGEGIYYSLFAPLIGENMLYANTDEVVRVVNEYIGANDKAIEAYLRALLGVGKSIYALPSQGGSNVNAQAALSIHANATNAGDLWRPALLVSADPDNPLETTCKKDMASKFHHFFKASNTQCGIVPLEVLMKEFINKQLTDGGDLYYRTTYYNRLPIERAMTGFHPNERQGVSTDGLAMVSHPITADLEYSAKRNTYSTKFFNMAKIMENTPSGRNKSDYDHGLLRESDYKIPDDLASSTVKNYLKYDATSGLNKKFYLDF